MNMKKVSLLSIQGSGLMVNPGTDYHDVAEHHDSPNGWCWVEPYVEDTNAKVFRVNSHWEVQDEIILLGARG